MAASGSSVRGHHPAVDRRLDRLGAELLVHRRPGEEVEVGGVALGELAADEVADGHHAGFFVHEGGRGLFPRPAVGILLVERQERFPLREDVLHALVGPALPAGHQVHVELVAVQAEVELVERAHRRPAAVVAERERDDARVLHVRRQGHQVLHGRRPPTRSPRTGSGGSGCPSVVGPRHEVELAVLPGRGELEALGHGVVQARLPDVVDGPSSPWAAKNCIR